MRGCCNECENNQNKLWKGSKISSKSMTIISPKSYEQNYWEEGEIKRYTKQNPEQSSSLVNNSPETIRKKRKRLINIADTDFNMVRTRYETAIVVREIKTTGDLDIMRKTIRCGPLALDEKTDFLV